MKRVVVVGGGVAGSEAGTYLGYKATTPLEIVEVECEPTRRFGGWGFQKFPITETTNLAMRKMYLGDDPDEIFTWAANANRLDWPSEIQGFEFHPDRPIPRVLMQQYVIWRRSRVGNRLVSYSQVIDEAMRVTIRGAKVVVELKEGREIECDRLVMASGSISVKIPNYLDSLKNHDRVIIDPLTIEGHERRAKIPQDAKVLVLGTGLTGEEQINVLLKSNHTNLALLSREGQRHFRYEENQANLPLSLTEPPHFLMAETPEEFNHQLSEFFEHYLTRGHSPEDIFAAVRPFWDKVRADLGGCVKAAERLKQFKRSLAVNSIGVTWEVSENMRQAESDGKVSLIRGHISEVAWDDGRLKVVRDGVVEYYDYIINAVGRNIIRHPIWDRLLEDGIAKKHAGIGVRVSETGRMVNAIGEESGLIWVVGMARAGDHTLRHGFLGNTAFNVPQVRSHLYDTIQDLLSSLPS